MSEVKEQTQDGQGAESKKQKEQAAKRKPLLVSGLFFLFIQLLLYFTGVAFFKAQMYQLGFGNIVVDWNVAEVYYSFYILVEFVLEHSLYKLLILNNVLDLLRIMGAMALILGVTAFIALKRRQHQKVLFKKNSNKEQGWVEPSRVFDYWMRSVPHRVLGASIVALIGSLTWLLTLVFFLMAVILLYSLASIGFSIGAAYGDNHLGRESCETKKGKGVQVSVSRRCATINFMNEVEPLIGDVVYQDQSFTYVLTGNKAITLSNSKIDSIERVVK